jgi:hypothetical protein
MPSDPRPTEPASAVIPAMPNPDEAISAPPVTAALRYADDDMLTTGEVEKQYKLKASTLRYWRHKNYGPACFTQGPRKIVYRRSEVEAWLAEQERLTRRGGTAT